MRPFRDAQPTVFGVRSEGKPPEGLATNTVDASGTTHPPTLPHLGERRFGRLVLDSARLLPEVDRHLAYSGSRLHNTLSGVPEPAEDVLGGDLP